MPRHDIGPILPPAPPAPRWAELGVPVALITLVGILFHLVPVVPIGFLVLSLSILLAYRAPRITLGLTILLGQVAQFELAPLLGISPEGLTVGTVNVRLSDPLVFGMVVTVFVRLITRDGAILRYARGEGSLLLLFLTYLLLRVVANVGTYGITSPGEFRTYFQFLLFVPYLVVTTKTEGERRSVFLLLITLSFSQLLWALLRAYLLYDMTFSAYEKWLSGFGSLALLYGTFAYAAACREQLLTQGNTRRVLVYSASIAMILIAGARAVWFAAVCALVLIAFRRQLPARHLLRGGILLLFIILVVLPLFLQPGVNPGDFLRDRLLAFTDFTSDPTAAWRYTYWVASLGEIMKAPWLGHGFGLHFDVYVPQFRETLSTSPHNLYLSTIYQVGIFGLFLYLAWIFVVVFHLKKHQAAQGADKALVGTALLVLLSIHAYGIAYSFEKDFFTWSYIGLAISSMVNAGRGTTVPLRKE